MKDICVIELESNKEFKTKQIDINQYYPTDVKDLFHKEGINKITQEKWDNYLVQFNIGKLKPYIWSLTGSIVNSGWIYLLAREVAHRKDLLSNIYEADLNETHYSPFIWVVWSSKWIYMGWELEDNFNVLSIPKNKI